MSNPHPLDIFRSSEQGFDAASRLPRKRRTVTGKIVRTQARPAPAAAALSKAGKGKQAARRKPARPKSRAAGTPRISNRALLYTALALVTTVTGWVVIPQWFGGESESGVVPLRRESVFSTARDRSSGPAEPAAKSDSADTAAVQAPPRVPAQAPEKGAAKSAANEAGKREPEAPPASSKPAPNPVPTGPVRYTVLVATYKGSQLSIAQGTARQLEQRGFQGVRLLGYDDSESGGYTRVELVVGNAASRTELDRLRDDLRAIDDWGSGREAKPFHDARVIEHPNPDAG